MAFSGNPDTIEHIIIRHGSRRRLLAKPPTFELLMQRSCEIFGFAANTEVCAYFMYRNNLGNNVNMELDPSAYFFLKSGDELEWKSTTLSPGHFSWNEDDHHGPRYLGGGYEPTTRAEASVREIGSEQNSQDDGSPIEWGIKWAQDDEEDDTWAGGYVQTSPPGLWREDGCVNLDWRPENGVSQSGVQWSPPPPPSSITCRIIRELKEFNGQQNPRRSPAASAERGVFSPRPDQKHIEGNEWLRPMPSGYSPPLAAGHWARDAGTPTKGPRYKTLESWLNAES